MKADDMIVQAPRLKMQDGWPVAEDPLPADLLDRLVYYARLAPSSHNSQPWKFLIAGDEIDVFAEQSRWLRIADPERREMMLSLGCAIELLRIAADFGQFGTQVKYFPLAGNESLVARVQVARKGPKRDFPAGGLLEHALTRRTSHRLFDAAQPVSDANRKQLYSCFQADDVSLDFATQRVVIDGLAAQELRADAALFANPEYRKELANWVGEGFLGTSWLISKLGQFAIAHLPVAERIANEDSARLLSAPLAALLTTRNDTPTDRIHAGEAFMRIALMAESHQIRLQPMSQLLEDPASRARVCDAFGLHDRVPQHLFRLGHAQAEQGAHRRFPLSKILVRDQTSAANRSI